MAAICETAGSSISTSHRVGSLQMEILPPLGMKILPRGSPVGFPTTRNPTANFLASVSAASRFTAADSAYLSVISRSHFLRSWVIFSRLGALSYRILQEISTAQQ